MEKQILQELEIAILLLDSSLKVVYANDHLQTFLMKNVNNLHISTFVIQPYNFSQIVLDAFSSGTVVKNQQISILKANNDFLNIFVDLKKISIDGQQYLLFEFYQSNKNSLQDVNYSYVNKIISRFIHEIKNPLSGIKGALQIIKPYLEHEVTLTASKIALKEIERLVALSNRFISIDKSLNYSFVNIHEILNYTVTLSKLEHQNINFLFDYDISIPPCNLDKDRIVQLVLNLLQNAINALKNKPNAEILMKTRIKRGENLFDVIYKMALEISVIDNGDGIVNFEDNIFNAGVSLAGGSGLGLSISSNIASMHKGRIYYNRINNKTHFIVLLPLVHSLS